MVDLVPATADAATPFGVVWPGGEPGTAAGAGLFHRPVPRGGGTYSSTSAPASFALRLASTILSPTSPEAKYGGQVGVTSRWALISTARKEIGEVEATALGSEDEYDCKPNMSQL